MRHFFYLFSLKRVLITFKQEQNPSKSSFGVFCEHLFRVRCEKFRHLNHSLNMNKCVAKMQREFKDQVEMKNYPTQVFLLFGI